MIEDKTADAIMGTVTIFVLHGCWVFWNFMVFIFWRDLLTGKL